MVAGRASDRDTLSNITDDDAAAIDIVDLTSRQRRRLWSCEGGASMHGASIAWSPDGHLIAATYYHAPTDELATAVIDADNGTVVADHEYRVAIGCPNGTWVDNDRVVLVDDLSEEQTPPLYLVNVRSGNARRLSRPPRWKYYLALVDGHFFARADDGNLCLTDLDGDDSEPFLTMAIDISTFDIAPHAGWFGPGGSISAV